MNRLNVLLWVVITLAVLSLPKVANAQALQPMPDFSFDNFAVTYYLDRDSKGVATLTVQENMTVDFPSDSKLHGIQRSLPETYQGHSLSLKLISVTDAAGDPIKYKQSTDGNANLLITTGDPDIILSGFQTYQIKYQTNGVAAIYSNHDEFLVDVNGRQWQEQFKSVKAFINISKSFSDKLVGQPTCYIGYQNKTYNACVVKHQSTSTGEFVQVATNKTLGDHTALVVKLEFKKGTFSQSHRPSHNLFYVVLGLSTAGIASWIIYRRVVN